MRGLVGGTNIRAYSGMLQDAPLPDGAVRPVLRGEQSVLLREATAHAAPKKARRASAPPAAAANLGQEAQVRFINLKAWRAEVAREHNLPAYVIFHDATLREMCTLRPLDMAGFGAVSGVGARKREKYGDAFLRIIRDHS